MRSFSTLFVFYLLSFVASVAWSYLGRPDLLPAFTWQYLWASAFVRFVDYAIPITAAGAAVAYSLFIRAGRGPRRPFHRIVGSQLTLLVVLALLYTVLLFGFYPRSRTLLGELEDRSRQGQELLASARDPSADPARQLAAYDRYLAISPKDQAVLAQRDELLRRQLSSAAPAVQVEVKQEEARVSALTKGKKPHELLADARAYLDKEDWFSALYYADLTVRLATAEEAIRRDAERLKARAWEKIRSQDPSKFEAGKKEFFLAMKRGYQLFQQQDYLAAYFHFQDLHTRDPRDLEAALYLERSRAELAQVVFFREEAELIDLQPGAQDLLFVNERNGDTREIVFIGKMVSTREGTFFKDIEVLRHGPGGLTVHFTAPYGKLALSATPGTAVGGSRADILLRGIDSGNAKTQILPRYWTGAPARIRPEEKHLLRLVPRPEELAALRAPGPQGQAQLQGIGLDTLWRARSTLGDYGQLEEALSLELLMRLLLPFAFLNLSLLAMAAGWAYRFGSLDRPPVLAYVVIPIFPVAAVLLAGLYLKVHRILAAFALLTWGFHPALIALAALQAVILGVTLVILAGQASD